MAAPLALGEIDEELLLLIYENCAGCILRDKARNPAPHFLVQDAFFLLGYRNYPSRSPPLTRNWTNAGSMQAISGHSPLFGEA